MCIPGLCKCCCSTPSSPTVNSPKYPSFSPSQGDRDGSFREYSTLTSLSQPSKERCSFIKKILGCLKCKKKPEDNLASPTSNIDNRFV